MTTTESHGMRAAVRGAGRRGPATAIATAMVVLGAGVVAVLVALVVWTHLGQRADERSAWSIAVPDGMHALLRGWLGFVGIGLIAAVALAGVAVALARRRPATALAAVVLVGGANITTQVLKDVIPRPSYGVGNAGNSLPSGHTTVMLSLLLVAVLVLPRGLRLLAVIAAAAAGTVTGAAVILERWHRPSDVIAASAVCLAWAGAAAWIVARGRRRDHDDDRAPRGTGPRLLANLVAGLVGAVAVGAFLIIGGLVSHGDEPGNVVVGGIMLTAAGLSCALSAAALGSALDAAPDPRPRRH